MKKNKIINIANIVSFISVLVGIYLSVIIMKLDVLPFKYFFCVVLLFFILDVIFIFLIHKKHLVAKVIGYILLSLFLIFSILLSYYLHTTNQFFNQSFSNAKLNYYNTYYVVVRNDSNYDGIHSLEEKELNYYSGDIVINQALEKVREKIRFQPKENSSLSSIVTALTSNQIDFLLISDTNYKLMFDVNFTISKSDYKILYQFKIYQKEDSKNQVVENPSQAFNVFIGGVDFTNNNMDLNMVLTVNPEKHSVLLTSIPRDFYIEVAGFHGKKDTLSYMGSLGITTNMKSVQNLLNTKIDYYLKIETTSLVRLVDEVGGINYCSDSSYTTTHALVLDYNDNQGKKLNVKKGCQRLNGIETLTVARERLAFPSGDRQRQKNCQAIIIDIIEKIASMNTIANYNNVLNAISDLYETTIPKDIVTNIIKDVVDKKPNWDFRVQSVNGSDARDYVHMTDLQDYVMYPNMETVYGAAEEINFVLQ